MQETDSANSPRNNRVSAVSGSGAVDERVARSRQMPVREASITLSTLSLLEQRADTWD